MRYRTSALLVKPQFLKAVDGLERGMATGDGCQTKIITNTYPVSINLPLSNRTRCAWSRGMLKILILPFCWDTAKFTNLAYFKRIKVCLRICMVKMKLRWNPAMVDVPKYKNASSTSSRGSPRSSGWWQNDVISIKICSLKVYAVSLKATKAGHERLGEACNV